ncbi:sigma-54 interaction domain-containing protein [Zavarzinia compransoris]|uniref:HTH-type transcriptional regulatory protein TyrR n=1 Tax=Zavarzinia compransoris TaxID=1264899 RepID=A0A317E460_9PROT|nr:sigma 54-interacting transcriptional regulator [Zavarzinia compransoris]PWR21908.1 transcriptional regulator [Zavarzinia compransoris]TDP47361.1 PAS domain S-box-containing protein [Zavarzinia compransoris]
MVKPAQISPFRFGVLETAAASWAELQGLLGSEAFQAFADVLPDGIIVIDAEDRVRCLNRAAERATGTERREIEGRSLERLLRQSSLDFEDFLAACDRGQAQGVLRGRTDGRSYLATRRLVICRDSEERLAVLLFRDAEALERPRRGGAEGRLPGQGGDPGTGEDLFLGGAMAELVARGVKAYGRRARILLLGESGVGKTAIARHLHLSAGGRSRPFVHVNCGSIPETLFESEMFGYERGAFTGALQTGKRGYIESAAGGTLFLDEIGEIPLVAQAKLLKFLEDGTIQPVGAAVGKRVETRIIAATNRDLEAMMAAGSFRRDLFYRISTFTIRIPSLRERADREGLLDLLLARVNAEPGTALVLSPECRAALLAHDYPGNVRELMNLLEHLAIVAEGPAMPADLPAGLSRPVPVAAAGEASLKAQVRAFEEAVIRDAVNRFGSKREAARHLGVDIATLVRKTKKDEGGQGFVEDAE